MTEENVFKTADLAGCEVATEAGEVLGTFKDVLPSRANDVWVVQGKAEYLLPAKKDVVLNVDLTARKIVVRLPKGLRELYEGL